MKVYDIRESKSGKSDIIVLVEESVKTTPLGQQKITRFYNMAVEKGTSTVSVDEELDITLDSFNVRESVLDNGATSLWLEWK